MEMTKIRETKIQDQDLIKQNCTTTTSYKKKESLFRLTHWLNPALYPNGNKLFGILSLLVSAESAVPWVSADRLDARGLCCCRCSGMKPFGGFGAIKPWL